VKLMMKTIIKNPVNAPEVQLEAVVEKHSQDRAVVICHPHPLYGGNMDNYVVMAIAQAFEEKGWTTLRFNFRGTGNSTGSFDNGNKETKDVRAAFDWLYKAGFKQICLAGYSFGAWVNAKLVSVDTQIADNIRDHIMVSPPVAFIRFDNIFQMPSTGLIITGRQDDIAPPGLIEKHIQRWGISPQYEIIENCDHFYSGGLGKLEAILGEYLD
jgi:uncharacterized protein